MTSKVGICNMALSAIGQDSTIADITESTKAARVCRVWFDTVYGAVLQDFPWNFARRFIALAESQEAIPGWDKAYAYPSDCISAEAVTDAAGARIGGHYQWGGVWSASWVNPLIMKVPFEVFAGAQASLVATDLPKAYLLYTARIDDTERYPPMFVECLALRLASAIAMPLSASAEVLSRVSQAYEMRRSAAITAVMNEAQQDPEAETPALGARW